MGHTSQDIKDNLDLYRSLRGEITLLKGRLTKLEHQVSSLELFFASAVSFEDLDRFSAEHGLSIRAKNALHHLKVVCGVTTMAGLAQLSSAAISSIPNCGRKTAQELHAFLISTGVTPNWT